MTPKEEERILDEAKKRYKIASEAWEHIYDELKSDLRFTYDVDGGQWSEAIKNERGDRPTITVNKLQKFVRQIRGDMLQNRPRVNVIPVDSVADPQKAELFNGIIREIEYLSSADIAYDTAYNYAVSGSVGYWRILTEYAEGDTFDQDIKIKRIINPTSVHFDPEATEFCLEDAKYCFIETLMSKERFEEKYKDVDVRDFSGTDDLYGSWVEGDSVRLAEYYVKEPVKRKIAQLEDGTVVELKPPLNEKSPNIVRVREVDDYKIMWYLLCGVKVLKSVQWVGKYIPVIPVFGDEIIAGGKKFYLSMIRGAKGAQQMYNYWARLSLDTKIPTPSGWTTMGEVQTGDILFDENGKQCKVLGKSPVFDKRPCFKVSFSNQTSIIADDEHLWDVEELVGKKWVKHTLHTIDLKPEVHKIRVSQPLDTQEAQLPISPYVLGLWITDGDSKRAKIFANEKTLDEIKLNIEKEGLTTRTGLICKSSKTHGLALLGVRKEFTKLNLLENKHIPKEYLRGSFSQRLALLQGMMDGDGTCKETGQCQFAAEKEHIAVEFAELLRSLGFKGTYNKQSDGMYVFSFAARNFDVFRLKYKLERQYLDRKTTTQSCRYSIISVDPVSSVPVQCVKVDSPNSLFLAGDGMIPTHNSAATENVMMSPKSPYVVDHRQVKGFETEWNEANKKNRMFIRYNAIAGMQKPSREPQTQVPNAIIGMLQSTAFDIEDHLGRYESSKGEASNERSGKAIVARIKQSDKGTYTFVDNLTRAIIYSGRQLVDLIPKIYDTKRALRIRGEDGQEQVVNVNDPTLDQNGNVVLANDLSVGKFDLIAAAGASYGSQRQEMVQMMIEAMQYAPQLAPVIAPLVFKYSDWPGASEVATALQQFAQQQPVEEQ